MAYVFFSSQKRKKKLQIRISDILSKSAGPVRSVLYSTEVKQEMYRGKLIKGGIAIVVVVAVLCLLQDPFMLLWALPLSSMTVYAIVKVSINKLKKKAQKELIEKLPVAIDLIANALSAGRSVYDSIALVVDQSKGLLRDCFQEIVDRVAIGDDLTDSMASVAKKLNIYEFNYLSIAVKVSTQAGGNSADVLRKMAENIREKNVTVKEINALTSGAMMQVYVLAAMPFFVVGMLLLLQRETMMPLFTTSLGLKGLAVCLVVEVLGFLVAKRFVRIDL